ncbi:MAG: hypothetical protein CVU13_04810 [Bacteroidetes bacterium HGW-Bacteroidetes-8]|jgi:ferric-dicitrate binding protein FerR (iron transport regulator)|nr:MAG: hypothetical protein CVU13_04810 [Bacteroidetes bacterium HGW-Bacteroidetes-8]
MGLGNRENSNEGNKYVGKIMRLFAVNEFSEYVILRFQHWFVQNRDKNQKDNSLENLWDSTIGTADGNFEKDFNRVMGRISGSTIGAGVAANKGVSARLEGKSFWMIAASFLLIGFIASYIFTAAFSSDAIFSLIMPSDRLELTDHYVKYSDITKLILPDGTEVSLNSGSTLIYPKRFIGKKRMVYLSGEANFRVTKDNRKNFVVKTADVYVEALGTTFNVSAYSDDNKVETTLLSGRVRISSATESFPSIEITPNEQVVYDKASRRLIKRVVDANSYISWTQGHLVFQGASFETVIKKLERFYDVTVNYDLSKYKGKNLYVKFTNSESLSEALDVLSEMISGFNYKISGKIVIIY